MKNPGSQHWVRSMDHRIELLTRRADIWFAKASLATARARYFSARARHLQDTAVDLIESQKVQILHPKEPPPPPPPQVAPSPLPEPPVETQELEIKGAYCPKWTKRPHHFTLATNQKVIGEKHPINEDAAFFVMLGDEIGFVGLVGAHQSHAELGGYAYQHSVHDGLTTKIKFEEFAKHYKLDVETCKQLTKPRAGPKLDKRTTDILEDIAIKMIESGRLLA